MIPSLFLCPPAEIIMFSPLSRPTGFLTVPAAFLLFLPGLLSAQSGGSFGRFRDPEDGRFDLSAHLVEARGFLPVVSLITEPAVDYGIAGAAAFFHRPAGWSIEEARDAFNKGEPQRPPSVSVVAGGYTLNDSWMAGGGHLGIWREDRLRYVGFGGYGSFNLTLSGLSAGEKDLDFEYNLEGWALVQSLRWRLSRSRWFLGATMSLSGLTVSFDVPELPEVGPVQKESRNGSVGAVLAYDSRDNIFTPSRGIGASLEAKRYDDAILGDYAYWQATASTTGFVGLGSSVVLGARVKAVTVGDGAPFWGLAAVQMRGVPAQRYLGSSEAQGEAEIRWDLDRRWSLVAFGGAGWTRNSVASEAVSRTIGAGGAGFRYLLARAFGVRGGLDMAYGPDGVAVYVTVGSAFR